MYSIHTNHTQRAMNESQQKTAHTKHTELCRTTLPATCMFMCCFI